MKTNGTFFSSMVITYNDDISDNHFKTPESEVMWDAMCTLRLFFTLKHF